MTNLRSIAVAVVLLLTGILLGFMFAQPPDDAHYMADEHGDEAEAGHVAQGPHGGRMLEEGDYAVELVMFEGAAPEFHAYPYHDGEPVSPEQVQVSVTLERLDGTITPITFAPAQEFLQSTMPVPEPHSFDVTVESTFAGESHRWRYESHEGRTTITTEAAEAAGLQTATAGPESIRDTVLLYGTVRPDEQRVYDISARFGGVVREVRAGFGDRVEKGDVLAIVENNDSLQRYPVEAPADGIILARHINRGEAAEGALFTLADLSEIWVDFAVFPRDQARVARGQSVHVIDTDGAHTAEATLGFVAPVGSPASQSVLARAVLPNPDGSWTPGLLVTGEITVARHGAPVAVRVEALQTFQGSTVVFAKYGDVYEARPLELGPRDEEFVQVRAGIEAGTDYVTANSYVIKADLLKSGASHAH